MRTTRGKPTLDVSTTGDAAISAALAASLRHEEQVDRATHGFHTWPAGLHPETARELLPLLPAGRLLDPFCWGSARASSPCPRASRVAWRWRASRRS